MRKRNSHSLGFTIVELLIVIVVIAVLASISAVAYTGIQQRARTSAQQHAAAQAERAIMAHALQANGESISLSGTIVGYKEGAGEIPLLKPLSGTPDITMYAVYSVTSTSSNYSIFARLTPAISNQLFQLQTGPSGGSSMGFRIDTSELANDSYSNSYVRFPGNTVIGWLQVSDNATTRAYGYNQASASNTRSLAAHAGWDFTDISLIDNSNSGVCRVALVFDVAHDETTRAQVLSWLANKYGVNL